MTKKIILSILLAGYLMFMALAIIFLVIVPSVANGEAATATPTPMATTMPTSDETVTNTPSPAAETTVPTSGAMTTKTPSSHALTKLIKGPQPPQAPKAHVAAAIPVPTEDDDLTTLSTNQVHKLTIAAGEIRVIEIKVAAQSAVVELIPELIISDDNGENPDFIWNFEEWEEIELNTDHMYKFEFIPPVDTPEGEYIFTYKVKITPENSVKVEYDLTFKVTITPPSLPL